MSVAIYVFFALVSAAITLYLWAKAREFYINGMDSNVLDSAIIAFAALTLGLFITALLGALS